MRSDVFLFWEDLVEELPELLNLELREFHLVQLWKEGKVDAITDPETRRLRFGVASVSLELIFWL